MLGKLTPARQQGEMFAARDVERSSRAMTALDAVNARFGNSMLRPASTGAVRSWGGQQARHSSRYTPQVDEIFVREAF